MKKLLLTTIMMAAIMGSVFAGGEKESSQKTTTSAHDYALLINGNLGDKSFHDSANKGILEAGKSLDAQTKVVETGYDSSKWEPALLDLIDEKHDVIVCGTWQLNEIIAKVAPQYPEQKFIIYDTSMDYAKGGFDNVYSMQYKQNDGSFLAGVLAAEMSKTGEIGFIGGMDNTVILDFLTGYIQGAKTVNPDIKVIPSYIGNFSDSAKAKELAFAQYQMGVDIIFACASNASEGVLQAAKAKGNYCIGVDSDMAMLYKDSDPEMANLIISSMLKRVDQSIELALTSDAEGTLAYGTVANLGIAEDCIGLADNEIYQKQVPEAVRADVTLYSNKIKNGEITVKTAFNTSSDAVKAYIDSAR